MRLILMVTSPNRQHLGSWPPSTVDMRRSIFAPHLKKYFEVDTPRSIWMISCLPHTLQSLQHLLFQVDEPCLPCSVSHLWLQYSPCSVSQCNTMFSYSSYVFHSKIIFLKFQCLIITALLLASTTVLQFLLCLPSSVTESWICALCTTSYPEYF